MYTLLHEVYFRGISQQSSFQFQAGSCGIVSQYIEFCSVYFLQGQNMYDPNRRMPGMGPGYSSQAGNQFSQGQGPPGPSPFSPNSQRFPVDGVGSQQARSGHMGSMMGGMPQYGGQQVIFTYYTKLFKYLFQCEIYI